MKARVVRAGSKSWSIVLETANGEEGVDLGDMFVTSRSHAEQLACAWNRAMRQPPPMPNKKQERSK